VSLAQTGPDARWGVPILQGIQLAVEDANQRRPTGAPAVEVISLDGAALGEETLQRQRATVANYERLIADSAVVAAIGPQTSAESRAVAALLSRAGLATITPSATTFDITDPALKDGFRPGGRTVFFRAIGTDLAQGDAMARFAHARLGVRRVVLVEDGLDSQTRLVDAFERRATALGTAVLARRVIGWIQQDYATELRELAALKPDALYVAVRYAVGVKLARQIPDILPSVRLMGTDQLYNAALPIQARATRAEGWYVPHVAPDPAASAASAAWAERFRSRYGSAPSGYALTGYTAGLVVADAIDRVIRRGQPVTRSQVRDAIQATRLPDAPGGPVSFDGDGDLERPAVSIYQIKNGAFELVETILAADVARPVVAR
jgi:branched-chain amino acid transport system substrate-binding protein